MSRIEIGTCAVCLSKDITSFMDVKDHSISGEMFTIGQCNQCGFRFTENPPSEASCGPYYQSEDYISHSDTSSGFVFKVYHIVRNLMLGRKYQLLQSFNTTKTLLDVGSGTGYFPNYMQAKGYKVVGVEIDDKARNYSIEKFGLTVYQHYYSARTNYKYRRRRLYYTIHSEGIQWGKIYNDHRSL